MREGLAASRRLCESVAKQVEAEGVTSCQCRRQRRAQREVSSGLPSLSESASAELERRLPAAVLAAVMLFKASKYDTGGDCSKIDHPKEWELKRDLGSSLSAVRADRPASYDCCCRPLVRRSNNFFALFVAIDVQVTPVFSLRWPLYARCCLL